MAIAAPIMRGHGKAIRAVAKRCAAVILVAVVTATGGACGGDKEPKLTGVNDTGVDTTVGNLRILAVHVPAPDGDRYPRGSDLRVVLTIVNVGATTDTLTRATVPDAQRTAIRWDRNCNGTLETVDRLPVAPAGGTGPAEPAAAGPFDPYDVMAFSVDRDVPAGTTVGLTLTFQHAGRIVTSAYVVPKSAHIGEPVRRCAAPGPSTATR
jgi:periplasmic copper chaperone A